MIGEKITHYTGRDTDLDALAQKIEAHLQQEGFTFQVTPPSGEGIVIQARKGGFLDEVITADRALTILISGSPEEFTVRIGIGRWLEHLATVAFETLLLSELFFLVDVGEMVWTLEIEQRLARAIDELVG